MYVMSQDEGCPPTTTPGQWPASPLPANPAPVLNSKPFNFLVHPACACTLYPGATSTGMQEQQQRPTGHGLRLARLRLHGGRRRGQAGRRTVLQVCECVPFRGLTWSTWYRRTCRGGSNMYSYQSKLVSNFL